MAYIRKHGDGWRVEVQRNSQRTSKKFPTKREAQQWALEQEAQAKAISHGWHTFTQAADRYEEEVTPTKKGAKWERSRLESMRQHFGQTRLGELDAPHIAGWRDARLKTVTASTVVRESNLLKHVLRVARDEWRWMTDDPFKGVKMPTENEPRHQRWGWRQIRVILRLGQLSGEKTREVSEAFHIALRTGMRLQEVLAAPTAFDRTKRVITLSSTKTTGRVQIPVTRKASKLLDRQPFSVGPNEASTLFSKLCKKAGIEGLTFHDTRATALTLLSRKVDVMTLARISRHNDLTLLQKVYYRESAAEIAARL